MLLVAWTLYLGDWSGFPSMHWPSHKFSHLTGMLANHTGVMLTSLRTIVYSSYHTVIPPQDKNTHIHHFFTAHWGLGFLLFLYTVLHCDLPLLIPHCGEAPGQDSNPWRPSRGKRQGHWPLDHYTSLHTYTIGPIAKLQCRVIAFGIVWPSSETCGVSLPNPAMKICQQLPWA